MQTPAHARPHTHTPLSPFALPPPPPESAHLLPRQLHQQRPAVQVAGVGLQEGHGGGQAGGVQPQPRRGRRGRGGGGGVGGVAGGVGGGCQGWGRGEEGWGFGERESSVGRVEWLCCRVCLGPRVLEPDRSALAVQCRSRSDRNPATRSPCLPPLPVPSPSPPRPLAAPSPSSPSPCSALAVACVRNMPPKGNTTWHSGSSATAWRSHSGQWRRRRRRRAAAAPAAAPPPPPTSSEPTTSAWLPSASSPSTPSPPPPPSARCRRRRRCSRRRLLRRAAAAAASAAASAASCSRSCCATHTRIHTITSGFVCYQLTHGNTRTADGKATDTYIVAGSRASPHADHAWLPTPFQS